MKIIFTLLLLIVTLQAQTNSLLTGTWQVTTKTTENGLLTIEKESMHFNTNKSFSIVILVSVQKGEAFIKDLRIEASGIWENQNSTLVMVVQKVSVPAAKEVYLISQKSLENLASNFKYKYENDPIHIIEIKSLMPNMLTTLNKKGKETRYHR